MTTVHACAAAEPAAKSLSGSFTAAGQGAAVDFRGRFNITLWGSFVATVELQRSFDGSTWHPCTFSDGVVNAWTAPMSIVAEEPEAGVRYRLACTSHTSGTISYRVSQ